MYNIVYSAMAIVILAVCAVPASAQPSGAIEDGTSFGNQVVFLQRHTSVVILADSSGQARVAVSPDM